ncbi:DMT family transporter [Microbacteriaceae bacterium 4G12]
MHVFKYSLCVLIGACSYGIHSSIMKLGVRAGFNAKELVGGQYLFGWAFLLVATLLFSRKKVALKNLIALLGMGITVSATSVLYGLAVERLPASLAVVLLFQFTWMGIIIEAIIDRRSFSREKMIAALFLLIGTVLAGGVIGGASTQVSIIGVVCGVLSACSFALYIFLNGKIATDVPALNKSLSMVTGAMILVFTVFSPSTLYNGSLENGLWKYGILLGLLGILIPIVFFSIGVSKVGAGLGTILSAVELPAAVIVSVLILKEHVSSLQWIGIVLILIGIIVPQFGYYRKKDSMPIKKVSSF